jgi:hypothetical protein
MVNEPRATDQVGPALLGPEFDFGTLDTSSALGRYVAAIAAAGAHALAANVSAGWQAVISRGAVLPLTIEDGRTGGSYVTQPHSAFALYAGEELEQTNLGAMLRLPVHLGIAALGLLLRAGAINRIVQLDNHLLATNLHGEWDGADLPAIRTLLTRRFPRHFIGIRSLEAWSTPALLATAEADGWRLVPARQIWVMDDLERDWTPRNNCANDRRALRKSGLNVERPTALTEVEAERVAMLYRALYVERHSCFNPDFNARFVQASAASGFIRYTLLRDPSGAICAAYGTVSRGGVMTVPVLGYDLTRPASDGLYRIASYLYMQEAREAGLRLNGSAGAGHFKRQRGARGILEYMAIYDRHLPAHRRAAIAALRAIMEHVAMPVMVRQGI